MHLYNVRSTIARRNARLYTCNVRLLAREVAKLAGVQIHAVCRARQRGQLRGTKANSLKPGRAWVYLDTDVREWLLKRGMR